MGALLKLTGALILGLLVLVLLPVAIISGFLMRVRMRKVFRALFAIGAVLFAVHEVSALFDVDAKAGAAKVIDLIKEKMA